MRKFLKRKYAHEGRAGAHWYYLKKQSISEINGILTLSALVIAGEMINAAVVVSGIDVLSSSGIARRRDIYLSKCNVNGHLYRALMCVSFKEIKSRKKSPKVTSINQCQSKASIKRRPGLEVKVRRSISAWNNARWEGSRPEGNRWNVFFFLMATIVISE